MARFADLRLSEFLDALSRPDPTPGGGTASAITGAMGASLLMMVAGLAKSRTGADEERVALAEARATLASLRDRMTALADTDTEAFDQVMSAYRLPKATGEERAARTDAIQHALQAATEAPLETLRAAAEAMHHAHTVAKHGNRSAASDVGVAVALLEAAGTGAAANVRINLESLQDEAFRASAEEDVKQLMKKVSSFQLPVHSSTDARDEP